jgi:hypothetical protein
MPHISFSSFGFQWSAGTVNILRWQINLEKLILLLMDHQAMYDVSYIPNSSLFMFTGCIISWASTRLDFAGVFTFLRAAILSKPDSLPCLCESDSTWLDLTRLDSTLLVNAHSNSRFTDQEFRACRKRRVIFAPLSSTCLIRADICSVINLALINRLWAG